MGWDVYCCICGNSCKGGDSEYLLNEFKYFGGEEIKKKTTSEIDKKAILEITEKTIQEIAKKLKWCNKSITLYSNNKNKINYNVECEEHLPFIDSDDYGIFLHYDCWKFIKITYNIELHYNNLPVNYIDVDINKVGLGRPPIMNIDYGEIKKYWSQDMDFYKLYRDNNISYVESPLVTSNIKNINRIKKIITQFKLKKDLRPSPQVSATFYKENIIKLGNNKNFWIIKNNKWNEIKEKIVKKKIIFDIKDKKLYKIMKIPRIGEYNTKSLFIYNIKTKKKEEIIDFIGTTESINNFIKFNHLV